MFTKTIIALSAALLLGTSFASAAPVRHTNDQNAQNILRKNTGEHKTFEDLWFSMPQGEQ